MNTVGGITPFRPQHTTYEPFRPGDTTSHVAYTSATYYSILPLVRPNHLAAGPGHSPNERSVETMHSSTQSSRSRMCSRRRPGVVRGLLLPSPLTTYRVRITVHVSYRASSLPFFPPQHPTPFLPVIMHASPSPLTHATLSARIGCWSHHLHHPLHHKDASNYQHHHRRRYHRRQLSRPGDTEAPATVVTSPPTPPSTPHPNAPVNLLSSRRRRQHRGQKGGREGTLPSNQRP